jgi:hypothetical protein
MLEEFWQVERIHAAKAKILSLSLSLFHCKHAELLIHTMGALIVSKFFHISSQQEQDSKWPKHAKIILDQGEAWPVTATSEGQSVISAFSIGKIIYKFVDKIPPDLPVVNFPCASLTLTQPIIS